MFQKLLISPYNILKQLIKSFSQISR